MIETSSMAAMPVDTTSFPWSLIGLVGVTAFHGLLLLTLYVKSRRLDRRHQMAKAPHSNASCPFCKNGRLQHRPATSYDLRTSIDMYVCDDCGGECLPVPGSTAALQQDALHAGRLSYSKMIFG